MRSGILYFLIVMFVAAILGLSWLPQPNLRQYGFLPGWLAQWADATENMNLRTAIPFVFLGILCGAWLLFKKQRWFWWVGVWVALVLLVLIAEAGQLALPHRNFDWGDVEWGALGAFAGLMPMLLLGWVWRSGRRHKYHLTA